MTRGQGRLIMIMFVSKNQSIQRGTRRTEYETFEEKDSDLGMRRGVDPGLRKA